MSKPFALRKRQFAGYKTVCQVCGLCINMASILHSSGGHTPVWIIKTTYKVLSFKEEPLETTNEGMKKYYKFVANELEKGLV